MTFKEELEKLGPCHMPAWLADDMTFEDALEHASNDDKHWYAGRTTNTAHLTMLAQEDDVFVRRLVACNDNIPVDMLVTLSQDEDVFVRRLVARNDNIPVDMLVTLSQDEDVNVRWHVASNPGTPLETLVTLAQDADAWVRQAAKETLIRES